MKSIKTKLIIYFSILILVISVVFGFISLRTVSDVATEEAKTAVELLAYEGARLAESRIETQIATIEMLARRSEIQSMDWEIQQPALQGHLRQLQRVNFLALAVVYPDGIAYYQDGTTAELGDREYVRRAFEGEANVSDLLISRVTNQAVIMYATPIHKDGRIEGVLVGRRDGNVMSNITDDMGFGEMGYAYMINQDGTVIAHENRERVMEQWNPIEMVQDDPGLQSMAQQFHQILEEKSGVGGYQYQNNNLYVGYAPVEGTQWTLVITANEEEVLAAIPALQRQIILVASIILLVAIVLCYLIGNSITKPIISTIKHSEKIASLNITEDVPNTFIKRKDEIGSLALAFQTITDNLREFIKQIADTSQQVASSSEALTITSQQSAMAADEVAKTIEEIAKGAGEQAEDTEKGVAHISQIGELIEKEQKYIKDLNISTNEVTKLKDEGFEVLKDLVEKTNSNSQSAKEVYKIIVNTNESAEKIENASEMIRSIAEQTNLLALNAAIEAARAGEAGKGFAVVAEEIRKLAEQSNAFTEEIAGIIQELTDKTEDAVKTMEEMSKTVASQTESVATTNAKFQGIDNAIEKMKEVIVAINQSGETMENKKGEIIGVIQNLSAISQENAAGTEEASASVEEQTAAMEEIASSSEALAALADEMQKSIARFKY
ncbi:methyl-accepting chemotaxis sensory transducer with Cache sensor [Natronincola peptidivorans]|uniref:Methyl-accepting chemotaxis sensory transducer with Cache sensor n=1 Tax=Natronincola peptidivorans TaxID=426128 RepID=A0A1I0BVB3_9FIRM|nr:methyl-accepting chemotaxis protein [Natronincola peptidivorans]SET10574.1 methyl-accepting chemotaxis sensory transducer with Cache sensor [Natronincola peptidivorans]